MSLVSKMSRRALKNISLRDRAQALEIFSPMLRVNNDDVCSSHGLHRRRRSRGKTLSDDNAPHITQYGVNAMTTGTTHFQCLCTAMACLCDAVTFTTSGIVSSFPFPKQVYFSTAYLGVF